MIVTEFHLLLRKFAGNGGMWAISRTAPKGRFAGGDKEVMDARNSLVPSLDLNPVEHLWDL